jgi:hypothetical protein
VGAAESATWSFPIRRTDEDPVNPIDHRQPPAPEADWLALAARLADDGRDDEAAVVRVYWPALEDTVATCVTLNAALDQIRRHAAQLGRLPPEAAERGINR